MSTRLNLRPVLWGTRWHPTDLPVTVNNSRAPSLNLSQTRNLTLTRITPHSCFQHRVISEFTMNFPPTACIISVPIPITALALFLSEIAEFIVTHGSFLEIDLSPSPTAWELTLIRRLGFPISKMQEESGSHHAGDTEVNISEQLGC